MVRLLMDRFPKIDDDENYSTAIETHNTAVSVAVSLGSCEVVHALLGGEERPEYGEALEAIPSQPQGTTALQASSSAGSRMTEENCVAFLTMERGMLVRAVQAMSTSSSSTTSSYSSSSSTSSSSSSSASASDKSG